MQEVLASPSDYDLANAIKNNVVESTLFTRRDVRIATIIHSRDIAGMKGKTTKKHSKMSNPDEVRDVLSHIVVKNYSKFSLYIDAMHVNGIMFLVGVSKHIGLIQCGCIRKKTREKFLQSTLRMICKYRAQGIFDVVSIGADKVFDPIGSKLKDEPYKVKLTMGDANCHKEVTEKMI